MTDSGWRSSRDRRGDQDWFNRHRHPHPEADTMVAEVRALEAVEPVLAALLGDATAR